MGEAEAGMTGTFAAMLLGFMGIEAAGAGTALVIYLRSAGWRETEVGRHLAAYMGTLFGLYVVTFAAILVHDMLVYLVLLGSHAAFTAVLWQRAWLVWKAQRSDEGPQL